MRRLKVPPKWKWSTWALVALAHSVLPTAQAQSSLGHGTARIVRSYAIQQPDWALVQFPSLSGSRRGALAQGATVTVFNEFAAPGCKAAWWQVSADAWMCPDNARLKESSSPSGNTTIGTNRQVLGYVVVGKNGALGYTRRENVDVATPNAEMQRGFMLGFTQVAGTGDTAALLTTHDLWVPARDVQILSPSGFQGTTIDGELDVAWVYAKRVQIFASPDTRQQQPHFLDRLTRISIQGQQQRKSGMWLKFDGGWIKSTDLRIPEVQPPPPGVDMNERWIDVDTKSQTLVAYVGAHPVFATLVSTGKGKAGTEQATPLGAHRVWVKLIRSDMDNLESADAQSVYAVEAVPDVLFFDGGYGIHGTYWHDDFGIPRSHGCVNVSVSDAAWLFQFVGPHLPLGWSAVFPTAREPGTVVNVR
jgi:hypothetical protein